MSRFSSPLSIKDYGAVFFVTLVSIMFAITAVAKIVIVFQEDSAMLTVEDSVIPLSTSMLLGVMAMLELMLSLWLLLSSSSMVVKTDISGMVAALLLTYKAGVLWLGDKPCSCLGALIKWSPWLERHRSEATWALIIVMLLGSAACWLSSRRQQAVNQ